MRIVGALAVAVDDVMEQGPLNICMAVRGLAASAATVGCQGRHHVRPGPSTRMKRIRSAMKRRDRMRTHLGTSRTLLVGDEHVVIER
jgi:hypothetical protein